MGKELHRYWSLYYAFLEKDLIGELAKKEGFCSLLD